MTWNYRIIKRICPETKEITYALNEVFYSKTGKIMASSERDEIISDTPEEIIEVLEMMLSDAKQNRPILTEKDFE
jgi:hypothetical protein